MSVLLDVDVFRGIARRWHWDEEARSSITSQTQDVRHIVEFNKASYNDSGEAWRGAGNDFWHVARVPDLVLEEWAKEWARLRNEDYVNPYSADPEYRAWLFAKLDDPEWRFFKSAPVKIR